MAHCLGSVFLYGTQRADTCGGARKALQQEIVSKVRCR
jgi:hypothetical protein